MIRIRLLRILFLSIFCIWAFYRMWEKIRSTPHQSLAYLRMYSPFPRSPFIQDNKSMEEKKISFDIRSCSLSSVIDTSEIVTPFKIYVYDLPPKFNTDITRRLMRKNKCYSLEYCGMGEKLFDVANDMFVHDTHQFSLEVILHHKLLFSPYRTLDPDKADVFYIPAYIGLHCMEFTRNETLLIDELFDFLQRSTYFRTGKPHFSSVAKIEREMYFKNCPYLQTPETINVTYFGVETEFLRAFQYGRVLSVPYPSYVHFLHDGDVWGIPDLKERTVFILLCAGKRRSNKYRAQIMDQIPNKTLESFDDYVKKYNIQNQDIVMLYTNECSPKAKRRTIPWMRQSVFCLQPPGDSPTRKSFYDAVLSGCIPVLFPYPKQPLAWAFTNVFNYSEFTVTIPHDAVVTEGKKILDILRAISREDIQKLHNKVKEISQWFQYTSIDGEIHPHTDAMQVILQELNNIYKFTVDD